MSNPGEMKSDFHPVPSTPLETIEINVHNFFLWLLLELLGISHFHHYVLVPGGSIYVKLTVEKEMTAPVSKSHVPCLLNRWLFLSLPCRLVIGLSPSVAHPLRE